MHSLEARGVRCVDKISEVNPGETVVIRSHGASPDIYHELRSKGLNYIDATCPFVKRIHKRVYDAKAAGVPVIIIGEIGHPEVDGIIGWAGENSFAVYTEEEAAKLPHMSEAVVVAQTTITEDKWDTILEALKDKVDTVDPFFSICSATRERQDEAKEIAKKSDTVIVVGGKFSSNTRKLYELCKRYCKNVYYIEHYRELLLEKMCFDGIIGIVAGASTPDTMIREVFNYMIENEKVLPIEGEEIAVESGAAADTVEESANAAEATTDEPDKALEDTQTESSADVTSAEEETVEVTDAIEQNEVPEEVQAEGAGKMNRHQQRRKMYF